MVSMDNIRLSAFNVLHKIVSIKIRGCDYTYKQSLPDQGLPPTFSRDCVARYVRQRCRGENKDTQVFFHGKSSGNGVRSIPYFCRSIGKTGSRRAASSFSLSVEEKVVKGPVVSESAALPG